MVKLALYNNEEKIALELIKGFWSAHNQIIQSDEEALADLKVWTADKNKFYFILFENKYIGFVHLGSRGAEADWLENIFVLPEYQRQGIGTKAIKLIEEIVKEYSVSLYIEVAARNGAAISLYHKLGFDCLNSVSLRKDFPAFKYEVIKKEKIYDFEFEIRKRKKS